MISQIRGYPLACAVVFFSIFGVVVGGRFTQKHAENSPLNPRSAPSIDSPTCGILNNAAIHIPPNWNTFVTPAEGTSYRDPTFGCTIVRLTDSSSDETIWNNTHPNLMHYYSTLSAMNSDDTMVLITSSDGSWRIKSTSSQLIVPSTKMPKMNNGTVLWDASDPRTFYFTVRNALYKGVVHQQSVEPSLLYTFNDYTAIVSPAAADLSQDGDHISLVGQRPDGKMDVFVWSFIDKTKTVAYGTKCQSPGNIAETPEPGCIHKVQLTPDNRLTIEFAEDGTALEQGLRLWDGKQLIHLQDRTSHYDAGYDMQGNPVFIEMGGSYTLAGQTNACPSRWGLEVRRLDTLASAVCLLDKQPPLHVSYRGNRSQPWAAISFFDERKNGPELFSNNPGFQAPSKDNWKLYEDEIVLAKIDGRAVYRLAYARSRSAENYWAQPHAAISRDGKYVVFTSNMAHPDGCPANMHVADECTDVYLIKVH